MNAVMMLLRLFLFVCLLGAPALPPAQIDVSDEEGPSFSHLLKRIDAIGAKGEPHIPHALPGSSLELWGERPPDVTLTPAFQHQRQHVVIAVLAYAPGRSPPSA